jgi:hypothetical protein
MMASTVLLLLSGGDESQLDLGDIAIAALARATIALCEDPRNRDKIAEFQSASDAWAHVNRALGQE